MIHADLNPPRAFLVVGATLVLGGAQVVAGLSGVNVYAACFIVS